VTFHRGATGPTPTKSHSFVILARGPARFPHGRILAATRPNHFIGRRSSFTIKFTGWCDDMQYVECSPTA
jgi:hypothetical protein